MCGYNAIIHELNCPTLFFEPSQPGISGQQGQEEALLRPGQEVGVQAEVESQEGEP